MADADPIRPTTGPLRTVELIRDRAVAAVLGQSGLNHAGLSAELRRRFGGTDVQAGALVREPVIEGAAPFVSSGRTFADCARGPLHPDVVRAAASEGAGDYRFDPLLHPYQHQLEAWEHLAAPERRSVLVSSGTGSGKTECFLMPLLSDLAAEAETRGKLTGVRAIALYPLNALIASQEERLRAWTAPFGGRVRFGLYNGQTPDTPRRTDAPAPEQVRDRGTLRRDPPPILVTNVTMLEYMIVRRIDRPLIENSRGTLRWIILDEAHGYVGSAAAEIALLIRRVLLTFGVRAEDVRFVATSATIGGEGRDVTDELRRFLRDLSGAEESRVAVVVGKRETVALPPAGGRASLSPADLASRDAVARHPAVQAFVRAAEARPLLLEEARALLAPTGAAVEQVIEAVARTGGGNRPDPLLPLRIHGFLRAVPGLWSCLDRDCVGAPADWSFGAVLPEKVDRCPACASPVLEVKTCRECGEPYLECVEHDGALRAVPTPSTIDEFAAGAERDRAEPEPEDDGDAEPDASSDHDYLAVRIALAARPLSGGWTIPVEPTTGRRPDRGDDRTRPMRAFSLDEGHGCGNCGATKGQAGPVLRPLRYGAPFLIGNAAPVLLEGMPKPPPSVQSAYPPPAEGRQLLSFTDSRQGTARFAANLQTNAERGYVRGFLYHAAQGSMAVSGDPAKAEALRAEIATLEPVAATAPAIAQLVDGKKAELAALSTPSDRGIAWGEIKAALARTPEVGYWMTRVWGARDERYKADPLAFAEFLLLRELARRPRRANTAETMGLVRLRFDAVDHARSIPAALADRGLGAERWQGLLLAIVDMTVRAHFAIRASWDDAHWLHSRTPLSLLLPPGERKGGAREVPWPAVGAGPGLPSNLVLILEKALGLDRSIREDRARLNDVLEAAWTALSALFTSQVQPDHALEFGKARIAPVTAAWRCPVTGRVLPALALGLTPYGHREGLSTSNRPPQPIAFPRLPLTFPRGDQVEVLRTWLADDAEVAGLRAAGDWTNLHDRVTLLSPYLRAAEHSAQQPPARLRRFEGEFKKGEINILNCSTTMEMGVDIGSVCAVMMTNVPPALANYRQRVGRAGRRKQGFASSLTYTRDTPLDREAFRTPAVYLARETRAPRVKLDSRRIVQRHVNALLLARWFAGEGGEAMRTRVGEFFGLPADLEAPRVADAPVATCLAWIAAPDTAAAMAGDVAQLVRGTVLAGDRGLFAAATQALEAACTAVAQEWQAIRTQAESAPPEGKTALRYQLDRLVRDNLLKELGYRSVLPAHGFPTGVVPFVNDDTPNADERDDDGSRRRRSFPTRTLDIAIRDYAPGAEVVVDGLVYRSAGVTLNWQRPAADADAREIQNLKTFWMCPDCGAADCAPVAPDRCPACHAAIPLDAQRRFLEPAGFTADMRDKPHADTDEVTYVEPEIEQIVARGAAWSPLAVPSLGRVRASSEGLVFYSSRGRGRGGYHVCLECGRAAPAGDTTGAHPLKDHAPLRFTKKGGDGTCPGNAKPFKITHPIALGYETVTDVAEIQPIGLVEPGAAWAAASALREALARRLGVESGELGLSVRRVVTGLGQPTHSLFLYDRASGGAGFAPQVTALFDELLPAAAAILDCPERGCIHGCSACVLAPDLYRQAETLDRQAALAWMRDLRALLADVPEEDRAAAGAVLVRSVADDLAAAVERGTREVTLWLGADSDVSELGDGSLGLGAVARHLADRGAAVTLAASTGWLAALDASARLALRDAALRFGVQLRQGSAPRFANGATTIASAGGEHACAWVSRDATAAAAGAGWGQGRTAPVVRVPSARAPLLAPVDRAALLPVSGTRYLELGDSLDGTIAGFGERFADAVLPAVRAAGGKGALTGIAYADRYLQSPLLVRLLAEAAAGLRDALGGGPLPIRIATNRLKPNERQPYAPDHDWQWEEDRAEVLRTLLGGKGFTPELIEQGAGHGRVMTLSFAGGASVRIVLDQGFGAWRTPSFARWPYFGDAAAQQAAKLASYSALIAARGASYAVVTA